MKRAFQRHDSEMFHFDCLCLQFKDSKSCLLKSIYFKSVNKGNQNETYRYLVFIKAVCPH